MPHKILLYGANGYSGRLILAELLKQNLGRPLLAGRNEKAIQLLANTYNLDFDICAAADFHVLLRKHKEVVLVINAAGPFVETSLNIAKACISSCVHYIDITGEIPVFQQLLALSDTAKDQGVMLLPGAGFDVVPTDCMANILKQLLPDADEITLAFAGLGAGVSRGTAITSIRQLEAHTWIRQQGKLTAVPWRGQEQKIDFGPFKATCLPISWGDLQTAWVSTGIPNISVFTPFSRRSRRWLPIISKLLQLKPIRRAVLLYVRKNVKGPTAQQREKAQAHIIGEARNNLGRTLRKHLVAPEGYTFTALSVAAIAKRILAFDVKPGCQTPAMAYGATFVEEINGVNWLSR